MTGSCSLQDDPVAGVMSSGYLRAAAHENTILILNVQELMLCSKPAKLAGRMS